MGHKIRPEVQAAADRYTDMMIELEVQSIPDLDPWGYANNTHLLPLELIGPTGVDGWRVRLPGGREIGLRPDEYEALVTYPA